MTLKHVLKHFSKTEVQEDKTHPNPPLKREEVNVSCAKCTVKDFSPFTSHFSQLCTPHPSPLPQGAREQLSCAEHTEKNLSSNRPIVLTIFKKAAFTLAEVLITLGIIGVVAALTLPTLIQNHQKQAYVTGLKKAYANIQNAFAKMAYDEGVTDWTQTYCGSGYPYVVSEECFNRIKKQFNDVKGKYSATTEEECWGDSNNMCHYIYTNDGMLYLFDCGYVNGVLVDVNGDKGPNFRGRDRFEFYVRWDKNKIEPKGLSNYQTYCTKAYVISGYWGLFCTAKVLIEGKMDY